jgi:DTW domain-containing protein YfiP
MLPPHAAPLALPHAVNRLRSARLARSAKPFLARGGPRIERCAGCRVLPSHCFCDLRPVLPVRAGMCLLMADIEPLKPSNTGWLIADVVADTFAFTWARTEVDPALLALLADPQWQPYLVFPAEDVAGGRVVTQLFIKPNEVKQFPAGPPQGELAPSGGSDPRSGGAWGPSPKRPLFVLLDGTWSEASRMFRKSPYLDALPVLSLQSEQLSRYRLRRAQRDDHFCTSEVGALCLELAGETHAAQTLEAYLDVFTNHYLRAKQQQPLDLEDAAHQRLRGLSQRPVPD